jgi:hypothetical protein
MREQNDVTKLEFLMMVNDNIIVQRFFNVRDYNPKAKNSIEFLEYMNGLVENLNYSLKMKSVSYLLENQYDITNNPTILNTSFVEGPEYFNIFIKQNDRIICHRKIDAKIYPPKIRYTVDIRQQIKGVLYDLTDILSEKDLTFNYLGYTTLV